MTKQGATAVKQRAEAPQVTEPLMLELEEAELEAMRSALQRLVLAKKDPQLEAAKSALNKVVRVLFEQQQSGAAA